MKQSIGNIRTRKRVWCWSSSTLSSLLFRFVGLCLCLIYIYLKETEIICAVVLFLSVVVSQTCPTAVVERY